NRRTSQAATPIRASTATKAKKKVTAGMLYPRPIPLPSSLRICQTQRTLRRTKPEIGMIP
ncbi:hypothetical protein, partial [Bradyrhizobium sp.]|uniref:hypothetical protein n=1 Tax=Bradyrhizobium sp. TaxID=376 RepID=UPI003C6A4E17